MAIKDGYLEFFQSFKIDNEELIKFGLEKALFCDVDKAQSSWDSSKITISNKQIVHIRGYGRDAKGTILFNHLYELLFDIPQQNIIKDPTNNQIPTKLIQEWTGFQKSGAKQSIQNYQVSHIFGKTKNPYLFAAPFNIMFIPKILDPFTGHESKGELPNKFKNAIQVLAYQKFSTLIKDYNQIILEDKFQEKLLESIERVISTEKHINNSNLNLKKFKTDAIAEFAPILHVE